MSDRMDWLSGKTTTSTDNAQSARMQWLTETPDAARQEEKTNTAVVVAPTAAGDSSPKGAPTTPQSAAPTAPLTQGSLAGTGRSAEQVQQELNDSQTRYKQLLLTAPYAANAQDSAEISRQIKAEQEKIQSLKSELEPLTAPNTNAERDSLIRRMNDISQYEGYATTVEQADEVTREKQDIRQRLHQLDEELGNAARFYDSGERSGAVVKGALKQTGASFTKLLSTTMGANNQLYERSPELYKAVVTGGQPWLLPEDYSPDAEKMREDYLSINDKAVSLSESAAKDIAQAKEGLSALGQAGVDISVNLIQMGIDAAGRAVGLGMLPFFMRAAGGAMLEAEQDGADSWGQLGYGVAKGTIEVGTEKLFDGLAGIFGKGAADDVIEGLIGKLTGSNTGRTLLRAFAGAAGEGTEEVVSDLLDPFAKLIYNDQALKEAWENRADLRDQMLYDYLIGAAIGGLGSMTGIVTGQDAEKNAALAEADAQKQANPAPQPPAEQKNTALSQAESTTVNTDPAQHTAAEQAVIDEYQAAVDDKLVKYIEAVRDNKGAKIERYSLKPVAERAAKDIMQLTGVDASGNQTAIEARIIEHILKRHGENGTANHSMRDINDIARIQYVLDNYDTAAYGGKSQAYQTVKPNGRPGQADTVIFSKAVNGTYYVIEAVPVTKKKTVFITSAYMSNQKAGDVQTADADAWRVTSETKNAQTPAVEDKASINSISQSGGKYNSDVQSTAETTATARERQYRAEINAALNQGNYEKAMKLYREYGNPELRALKDFLAVKKFEEYFQNFVMSEAELRDVYDTNEDMLDDTVISRNTANGKPSAIALLGTELNNRQQKLIDQLPEYCSQVTVKKSEVSMIDLSAMTAKTGDEFAMFTKGGERLIVRGNTNSVNIGIETATQMAYNGYQWSGHTHPGFDQLSLFASDGDIAILEAFGQNESVIYNSLGQYAIFYGRK